MASSQNLTFECLMNRCFFMFLMFGDHSCFRQIVSAGSDACGRAQQRRHPSLCLPTHPPERGCGDLDSGGQGLRKGDKTW